MYKYFCYCHLTRQKAEIHVTCRSSTECFGCQSTKCGCCNVLSQMSYRTLIFLMAGFMAPGNSFQFIKNRIRSQNQLFSSVNTNCVLMIKGVAYCTCQLIIVLARQTYFEIEHLKGHNPVRLRSCFPFRF